VKVCVLVVKYSFQTNFTRLTAHNEDEHNKLFSATVDMGMNYLDM